MSKKPSVSGVVVFNKQQEEVTVLIIESKRKGNYGFPKGKKEHGETIFQVRIFALTNILGCTKRVARRKRPS
jgi:8-oxo-dGTP pyrophosphatase MutT (NUDIX family)